jgi:hypothetical protein
MDGYKVITEVIDAITVDKVSKFLHDNNIPFHVSCGHSGIDSPIIANPPGICTACGSERGPTLVCQGCGWVDPPTRRA